MRLHVLLSRKDLILSVLKIKTDGGSQVQELQASIGNAKASTNQALDLVFQSASLSLMAPSCRASVDATTEDPALVE